MNLKGCATFFERRLPFYRVACWARTTCCQCQEGPLKNRTQCSVKGPAFLFNIISFLEGPHLQKLASFIFQVSTSIIIYQQTSLVPSCANINAPKDVKNPSGCDPIPSEKDSDTAWDGVFSKTVSIDVETWKKNSTSLFFPIEGLLKRLMLLDKAEKLLIS